MSRSRVLTLTALAMCAFAGNSLLARAALRDTEIDAANFTMIRIVAGALALWTLLALRRHGRERVLCGNWPSALALFAYAICFSFAYTGLSTGTGALLLFGAVQATMIGWGLYRGERFSRRQWAGLLLALAGLVALLLPGLSAPPLANALLMLAAGAAWGVYSIRGKGSADPLADTAGNFVRAVIPCALLGVIMLAKGSIDSAGAAYAVASGALTSGVGYAVWYAALRGLTSTVAATVQLSVPVIAALAGIVLLGEAPTQRLGVTSIVILGGIALVIVAPSRRP